MENAALKTYTLITGASAGIGEQIAIECAKKGFNLFLVSLPETGLEQFSNDLKKQYSIDVQWFAIDLNNYESPQMIFDFAIRKNLTINILVNNAGVGFDGKFENLTTELIDQMILLNIRASTLLTFLFLPQMKSLNKAHILNISSLAAFTSLPNKCVYAATKTYLLFLTRAINYELKDSGVIITSIHPSGVSSKRALINIQKSSFIARITTLSPEQVAQISVKNMLSGNKFVVPGLVTKLYYYLGSFLPHGMVVRLVGRVFQKSA